MSVTVRFEIGEYAGTIEMDMETEDENEVIERAKEQVKKSYRRLEFEKWEIMNRNDQ